MYLSISKKILAWYQKHKRDLPWRVYRSEKDRHYRVLLSEFMLQQTQVKTVIPYFNNFYKKVNNLEKLASLNEGKILRLWEGLGYYRRARNLLKSAKILKKKYKSILPNNYEELIQLPGIGDYTAKAILAIAFDKSEIGIDGNVERVVSRIIKKKNKKIIFKEVSKFKVKKKSSFLMQGFMEIGATICKPTKPLCELCPINKFCKSYKNFSFLVKKNTINKKNEKFFIGFVLDQKNKLLLRNEKNFGPLKGFINIPLFKKKGQLSSVLKNISLKKIKYKKIKVLKIPISNFIANISLYKISDIGKIKSEFFYKKTHELKNFFISSFLKKILNSSGIKI